MSKQYPGGIISKTPVTPSGPYATSTASGIWTLDQQAYWQKLGQWPTAGNFPIDPQFNYVTMLLHGDGTNGAQNNTFLDSSSNTFPITRNGNTTQGSFSPYGSNWSNYFDGTGDRLSIASASALNIGSADMTMEFWMLIPSAFASNYRVVFAKGNNASGGNSYAFEGMASGELTLWVNTDGSSGWNLFNGTTIGTPTVGAWNHVVVCRSGTTWYSFMNGTRVLNTTGAGTVTASSTAVTIGDFSTGGFEYTGYVSNLRLVNGTAVYANATTCTVPTTPLTAVTNTALLTCQSNRFIDNSASPLTITINGTPSVQRFNPFGASTAYSTATIGGSGYFDGTGDYLSTPNSSSFAFGTGNFTVEFWYRGTDTGGGFGLTTGGSTGYWQLNLSGSTMYWQNDVGVSNLLSVSASPILNDAWNHVAVVRNSTTLTIYFNGVSVTSTSDTTNYSGTGGDFQLGLDSNVNYITGYIADYRIVKGTAVYTANFTPPTAPLTAITNTSLLLSMTNGAIFDNAMMNDLETVGNAQISTSVKKYGTGSLAFDGTGDYLKVNKSIPQNIFGGNFTIEFWFNVDGTSGYKRMFNNAPGTAPSGYFYIYYNGTDIRMYNVDVGILITVGTFTANTWTFLAISRSGSTTRVFVNGTQTYSYSGSTFFLSDDLYIGGGPDSEYTNGYIDDFRITAGYARYTANFTPPTAALFDYGPT